LSQSGVAEPGRLHGQQSQQLQALLREIQSRELRLRERRRGSGFEPTRIALRNHRSPNQSKFRTMTKPLNVAVIGTGFIGRVHVRSARLAGAHVVGVAASTPERSADAAASMNVPKAYSSGLDATRDPEVDVIHICTPNAFHMEVAQAALQAGKHVVCEKPLATSLSDARTLMNLANAKGLVATVPFVNRFHPMVREARARVQSTDTGRIFLIQGSYLQDWLLQPGDTNWRVDAAAGAASRA